LRLHFPLACLQLTAGGCCELEIPEWMFDLDHPGHYMRRIKSITLTVACVAGPYTGVHCRLQLLSSRIRTLPLLARHKEECCDKSPAENQAYIAGKSYYTDERYIATCHSGTDAIATSIGQDDAGLFNVNFADERYLPFEYSGAISRWRFELPPENNTFDMGSLTDVVMHMSFTAREGGPGQRRVANEAAQRHLPGGGLRYFDVRHEFSDAWSMLKMRTPGLQVREHRQFPLRFTRGMFPFIVGQHAFKISAMHVFLQLSWRYKCSSLLVKYRGLGECPVEEEFACVADADCPGLFHGILKVGLGPILNEYYEEFGHLMLHEDVCEAALQNVYLLCDYEIVKDGEEWGYDQNCFASRDCIQIL
jgi:SAM-dependent methyltransferase